MCAMTNFAYWPVNESQNIAEDLHNYSIQNVLQDSQKAKIRRPMFLVNNISKPEPLSTPYDKYTSEKLEKHLISPFATVQLTPEEYNQIIHKRNETTSSSKPPDTSPTKMRPFSCTDCGKTFLLKHHLTTHEKTHSGIKPHCCQHCGKAFTHKHCLNTHLLLHSSSRPYECPECKKSFTLKHHLLTHSRVHSRARPFICKDCGRTFPLKRHLVTHSKYHAGERPHICTECGESFAQKDHLVMHSRFHGNIDSFVCSDCGATFTRKFELVNHRRLHGKLPHSCPICQKEFLQKRTLITHMRYHSGEYTFNCPNCGDTFPNKHDLTIHTKMNHGTDCTNSGGTSSGVHEKPLACTECNLCFNSPEGLALHIKLHTGDSLLVNDLCTLTAGLHPQNFPIANGASTYHHFNKQAYNNHVVHKPISKPVAQAQKIKTHICKICSRAFSAKHGLQQHNKRHPEGTCAIKSHICTYCNKGFYQKNHLLLHQRQHMDVKKIEPVEIIKNEVLQQQPGEINCNANGMREFQ